MEKILVELEECSYEIVVSSDIVSNLSSFIESLFPKKKGVIVTDDTVLRLWGEKICKRLKEAGIELPVYSFPPGEESKCMNTVLEVYKWMLKNRIDRHSFLIALGGGVVGDLAGFVAATYMRGIPYIQVPTTLMAQVDSSIGGKTGVNLPEGKNLVGAFWQPKGVLIGTEFLTTLDGRILREGLAEVVKYGVIRSPELFGYLEENAEKLYPPRSEDYRKVVPICARIKAQIVSEDERETKGIRIFLNYGHTIGHAIETVTAYKQLLHGESVALGMVGEGYISYRREYIPRETFTRIEELLKKLGLPIRINLSRNERKLVLEKIWYDKKKEGNKRKIVLCKGLGNVMFEEVSTKELEEGIEYITAGNW